MFFQVTLCRLIRREEPNFGAGLTNNWAGSTTRKKDNNSFDIKFDHQQTGYDLVQAHDTLSCRSCHRPKYVSDAGTRDYATKNAVLDKTYLGLDRHCVGCHVEDDPHTGQFKGRGCDECHSEVTWKNVPRFSHQRTKYPLTGAHERVECVKCHEPNPPGAPPEQAGLAPLVLDAYE